MIYIPVWIDLKDKKLIDKQQLVNLHSSMDRFEVVEFDDGNVNL